MKSLKLTLAALVASAAFAGVAVARDQVQIAGSSTVLPYAKIVAETFGETYPDFKTPIVESGGTTTPSPIASLFNTTAVGLAWPASMR